MLRVGLFTERFFPDSYADAIRMTPIVDRFISDDRFEVLINTSTESDTKKYNINSNFIPAPPKSGKFIRLFFELLLALECFLKILFTKSYDLIIVTTPPFIVMLSCSIAAQIKGIPYFIDVRDIYPRLFFDLDILSENGIIGRTLTRLEEKAYRGSQGVVAATKGICRDISSRIDEPESITIMNGYKKDRFHCSQDKYEKFTVSFHGSLGRLQDIDLILYLARKCENEGLDIQFQIIGDGTNDYKLQNMSLSNITYHGRLTNTKTAKVISKAHLGISFRKDNFISRTSFPVKIFEYIGTCLPIIVTPVSEGGEFVEDNNIGYQFAPTQKDQIFDVIKKLHNDRSKISKLVEHIRIMRDEHSREKRADLFFDFVDSNLNKNNYL